MRLNPRHLLTAGALALLTLGGPAVAEDDASSGTAGAANSSEAEEGDDAPDVDDTVSGARPERSVGPIQLQDQAEWAAQVKGYEGRPHPPIFYLGGDWLGLDPEFIAKCHEGLELIYLRNYKGALKHFNQMADQHSGMGIGPVGQVLVWQALMLENFDFKFEIQYQTANRKARQELEEAIAMPGNEAWEYFLLAGMLGIDSIHTMRHEEYAKALNRGFEAIKAARKCQELAPKFVDIQLGDGLFDYWASVISQATKLIPDMADKREEGIKQMLKVEERSVFLRAPATLALTFTWIEEGKRKQALASALKNHRAYPNNVINNLVLGRVYMYNRKYADSERIFKHVISTDTKNQRVHYYLGRLYLRWGKMSLARASLTHYLAFNDLSDTHRAYALYYMGNIHYRAKRFKEAEKFYKDAWRVGKLKKAKRRLERAQEKQKG